MLNATPSDVSESVTLTFVERVTNTYFEQKVITIGNITTHTSDTHTGIVAKGKLDINREKCVNGIVKYLRIKLNPPHVVMTERRVITRSRRYKNIVYGSIIKFDNTNIVGTCLK